MKRTKKLFVRTSLLILLILPVLAFGHLLILPQQTYSIFISYSSFQKIGNIYLSPQTAMHKRKEVVALVKAAKYREELFWGKMESDPSFIYCDDDKSFKKYANTRAPAITQMTEFGPYIVISKDGADPDIISHEWQHAEWLKRIGFLNWALKIPTWFDEGLAMLTDQRSYYSLDSLKEKTSGFKNLMNIQKIQKGRDLGTLTSEQTFLFFSTAKYEISQWYSKEKLAAFIHIINSGGSFEDAWLQKKGYQHQEIFFKL